jgi:hypothetical protein
MWGIRRGRLVQTPKDHRNTGRDRLVPMFLGDDFSDSTSGRGRLIHTYTTD